MKSNNISTLRCASDIFNTTVFRKVVKEGDHDLFKVRAGRLLELCPEIQIKLAADLISKAYMILSDEYRVEYFYKNTILNELLTDTKFIQDAVVVFNEFKIHKSIADVVYINGKNRVYEIKTELDSPERLASQIADYKKMFSEISIVTHVSLYEKYLKIINDDSIGIYILDEDLKIQNKRKPQIDNFNLHLEVMLKTLKKKEIVSLIKDISGFTLQSSNMSFLDDCLNILNNHEVLNIQKRIFEYLKLRGLKEREMLLKKETIKELKYVCLSLSFTKSDYKVLYEFLDSPIF